jgi:Tfp pilus assembly protein PilN
MIRFNFLRSPLAEALERVLSIEVRPATRRAIVILVLCAALDVAACAVQRVRTDTAERAAATENARLLATERDVRGLREAIEVVARSATLARQVREMRDSGRGIAWRIAEIAARLPQKMRLESLHDDNRVVQLVGQADDYYTLARAIRDFARSRSIGQPTLVDAHAVESAGAALFVHYRLRLTEPLR